MKKRIVLTEQHWRGDLKAWIPQDKTLESMQLNGVLRDALFRQEVDNLKPLITLKLDNLTHFLVVNECAVASKLLREIVSAPDLRADSQRY
jgi:hypothetical protein